MKRCFKESFSIGLTLLFVVLLVSCGSEFDPGDTTGDDGVTESEVQDFDASDEVTVQNDTATGDLSDEDTACVPNCTALECGADPVCGRICGTCDLRYECISGRCVFQPIWTPSEYTIECGNDGMCFVPASTFEMGCHLNVDAYCEYNYGLEGPVHSVTLPAYYIDRNEVTVADYQECVDAGICTEPLTDSEMPDQPIPSNCNWGVWGRDAHPVNCVAWTQASDYCEWRKRRLPTEAEWEMAARGTDSRNFPWGIDEPTCVLTNYNVTTVDHEDRGCGTGTTAIVCTNSPAGDSPYGLCDMAGNVYEWVNDYYSATYYTEDPQVDPQGPEVGLERVIRGGSYSSVEVTLRTTYRNFSGPANKWGFLGFRCAKSAD